MWFLVSKAAVITLPVRAVLEKSTVGQYSPVRPPRSVGKSFLFSLVTNLIPLCRSNSYFVVAVVVVVVVVVVVSLPTELY